MASRIRKANARHGKDGAAAPGTTKADDRSRSASVASDASQPPKRSPPRCTPKVFAIGAAVSLLSPVWIALLLAWSFLSWAVSMHPMLLGAFFWMTTVLTFVWQGTTSNSLDQQVTSYAWSNSLADVMVFSFVAFVLLVVAWHTFPQRETASLVASVAVAALTTVALVLKGSARSALADAAGGDGYSIGTFLLAWTGVWVWVLCLSATRLWRPVTQQRLDAAEQRVLLATMRSPYVRRRVNGVSAVEILPQLVDDDAARFLSTPLRAAAGTLAAGTAAAPRSATGAGTKYQSVDVGTPGAADAHTALAPNGAAASADFAAQVAPGFGSHKQTLVLIHGFGAGNVFWSPNLDALAAKYNVYAVDWRGCGASVRDRFTAKDAESAEEWFVQGFEGWRSQHPHQAKHLQHFVLMAHSLGALIATRYTFQHPERVDQLILASPCGVPDAPPPPDNLPLRWRAVRYLWGKGFTPHAITRWLGPLGPSFIRTVLRWRTSWMDERSAINDGTLNKDAVAEYLYQSWAAPASGEYAMNTMLLPGAYAHHPIRRRFITEDGTVHPALATVPVAFIYGGGRDWMHHGHGRDLVAELKAAGKADVEFRTISRGGHQLFLNKVDDFNRNVVEAIEALAALAPRQATAAQ